MSKTTNESLKNLEEFLKALQCGRAAMYQNGISMTFIISNLAHADNLISAHEAIIADLRKLQSVEQEAFQMDLAMRSQIGGDGKVGRPPDGRDYHELFAIISPPIKKENA